MFDKFPILIEFYKLSDDFGQYLHYLFDDHSIRGKLSKEKEKKRRTRKRKAIIIIIIISTPMILEPSNRELAFTNLNFRVERFLN